MGTWFKYLLILLLSVAGFAQQSRYDSQALGPKGPLPNVIVSLCSSTATGIPCSPQIPSTTDSTGSTNCSLGSPVTPPGSSTCSGTSDALGNFGFWVAPGSYKYSITGPGVTGKTYDLTLGGISPTLCSTQGCINNTCNGATPGSIWLPQGATTGSPALVIPANCSISCATPKGCSIQAAAGINADFITTTGSNVSITNVIIDGNGANNASGSCMVNTGGSNFTFRGNTVQNCANHAVRVATTSDLIWIENNWITGTIVGGSGILLGNTPAVQGGVNSCVTRFHINHNTIDSIVGAADGIFVLGTNGASACTGDGEITGNLIKNVSDTGIEVGEGSQRVAVTGNTILLPSAATGKTGVAVRSALNITVSGNNVQCVSGAAGVQKSYFAWNGSLIGGQPDPLTLNTATFTGNQSTGGCASTGGSTGNDYEANSGANSVYQDNFASDGPSSYVIGASTTGSWAGNPTPIQTQCQNTFAAGTTVAMQGFGSALGAAPGCTTTRTATQDALISTTGTIRNLAMQCGTTGVNGNSGVLKVLVNGSASALTLTYGTTTANTTVFDNTHFASILAGQRLAFTVDTQAAETLANCRVTATVYSPN